MNWLVLLVLSFAVLAAVIGTPQWPRVWATSDGTTRLLWQTVALFNLTVIVGSIETLRAGYPTGTRWYVALVAVVLLLLAVTWRPALTALSRHRRTEETP